MTAWARRMWVLLLLPAVPAAAEAAHDPAREERATSALYRCFEAGLADSPNGLPPIAESPATELFFWHQLGEAHRELGGTAQLGWCKPYFVDPMRQAQKALLDARPKRAPPASRPHAFTKLQGLGVGASPVTSHHIVEAAEAHGASRQRGAVGAVVRAALRSPEVAHWQLIGVEQDFVVAAAQSLDTLLFHASAWHATSEAQGPMPTEAEAQDSRRRFVAQAVETARLSRAAVADEAALLAVGLVAGLTVDLFAHRGLTPAEISALHVAHAPFGGAQQGGVDRAAATAAVLQVWRATLGAGRPQGTVAPTAARHLADGRPEAAVLVSLARLAPEAQPLLPGELWQQVRHAHAFRALERGKAPPSDAAHWSVQETLADIVDALAAFGSGNAGAR